jgi:antitoxin CptB
MTLPDPDRTWDRLRWQCRRGMLEVDIVLERFLERHAGRISDLELNSFKELLDLPDNDLWDLIVGRAEATRPEWSVVIDKLRQA